MSWPRAIDNENAYSVRRSAFLGSRAAAFSKAALASLWRLIAEYERANIDQPGPSFGFCSSFFSNAATLASIRSCVMSPDWLDAVAVDLGAADKACRVPTFKYKSTDAIGITTTNA